MTQSQDQPLKAIRILRLLSQGVEVTIKDIKLVMGETVNGDPVICGQYQSTDSKTNETTEILLPIDIELNTFLKWCEELNDLEIPIPVPKFN